MHRTLIRSLFDAALIAADPGHAIKQQLIRNENHLSVGNWRYHLQPNTRVIVIGAGKATARMAHAVEQVCDGLITRGAVVVKYGHTETLKHVVQHEAAHPVPDAAGERGVAELEKCVAGLLPTDLVIACWSGGASALLPAPSAGLTLADKQRTTQALLASGADIVAVNTVRKHISRLKGGQFARLIAPAQLLCLAVSDVIGDDLAAIGSGPFVPDPTTFRDAQHIIEKYRVAVPESVARHIAAGVSGKIPDTPKAGDPCFATVHNHIVASNKQAVLAIATAARQAGYEPVVWEQPLTQEACSVGATFAAAAVHELSRNKKICLIAGGETTVTLGDNPGKGGRNQEFALSAAGVLASSTWQGKPVPITLLSGGTDGSDGPTDAAGAIADGTTYARGKQAGLNLEHHLYQHNAYPFFQKLDDLIMTGATGTNVMDVAIALIN
jgi:glycerate 2-kinase